jgi:hypothetical protein
VYTDGRKQGVVENCLTKNSKATAISSIQQKGL